VARAYRWAAVYRQALGITRC